MGATPTGADSLLGTPPAGGTGTVAAAATATGAGATARAVSQALASLPVSPAAVLAFCSGIDPGRAARELDQEAGSIPSTGMMGKGVIGASGAIERGCSAIALAGEIEVGIGVGDGVGRDPRAAAAGAASAALQGTGDAVGKLMLVFLDPVAAEQPEVIAGAYSVAGPGVPLAGGGAGGVDPAQLVAGSAVRDTVVCVAISSPHPISAAASHGCRPSSVPSIVTKSEGRLLAELDGRPAEDVYLEKLGWGGLTLNDGEFEAIAVTHPLAQPELNGTIRIRHVHGRAGGGALYCATRIPVNAAIDFTVDDADGIIASAEDAVRESVSGLRGRRPGAALLFDCAGRKRVAGSSLDTEMKRMLAAFPGEAPPVCGLFTYGEVARLRGAKGDLNHALVVCTLSA